MLKNLRNLALLGNALFFLWILWNGIDEGSRQTGRLELFALGSLLILLVLNFFLLWRQK
ncbi:MAG: hypothetical protein PHS53_02855 [Candidatus Pacebacteria bacterium]|nr:hypothetical protein [Candidatus Paceibacterota bacterium]MDD5357064.1 hypothetical protein [Candidatus Paceibacterota bacterium]